MLQKSSAGLQHNMIIYSSPELTNYSYAACALKHTYLGAHRNRNLSICLLDPFSREKLQVKMLSEPVRLKDSLDEIGKKTTSKMN